MTDLELSRMTTASPDDEGDDLMSARAIFGWGLICVLAWAIALWCWLK